MTDTRKPPLAAVLEAATASALRQVRVWVPGKVVRYDASKQLVDVQPLVHEAVEDEEGGRQVEALPVVPSVPVFAIGGGGYRVTFPIAAGDTGALLFSGVSLDRWLAGSGQAVDPEIDSRHALGDACFLPGVRPFGAPLQSAPTDHATIGADDGIQVHLRPSTICIGDESGSKKLVLDGDGATASPALVSWASVIETLLGSICTAVGVPNTITPVNQFSGLGTGNPGKTGNLAAAVASATQAKGK